MKTIKILGIILVMVFYSCNNKNEPPCDTSKLLIYKSQHFEESQKLFVDIDDGEYKFEEIIKKDDYSNKDVLLTKYCIVGDSIKIKLKIDKKDTIAYLPKSTQKIVFGMNMYEELFIFTEKDTDAWLHH